MPHELIKTVFHEGNSSLFKLLQLSQLRPILCIQLFDRFIQIEHRLFISLLRHLSFIFHCNSLLPNQMHRFIGYLPPFMLLHGFLNVEFFFLSFSFEIKVAVFGFGSRCQIFLICSPVPGTSLNWGWRLFFIVFYVGLQRFNQISHHVLNFIVDFVGKSVNTIFNARECDFHGGKFFRLIHLFYSFLLENFRTFFQPFVEVV